MRKYKNKYYEKSYSGRLIATIYIYEYRDIEYEVIYYHNGYSNLSIKDQHERAKYKINNVLDKLPNYNGKGANEDLEEFFKLIK